MKIRHLIAAGTLSLTGLAGLAATAGTAGASTTATPAQCTAARHAAEKLRRIDQVAEAKYRRLRQVEARLRSAGRTAQADALDAQLDQAATRHAALHARFAQAKARYDAAC